MAADEKLFADALQITDPAERNDFLERECAGNDELRRQIDELLRASEAAGSFLAQPATVARHDMDTDRTSALQVRCPHCHTPVELQQDAELESISCSSCGSDFSLVSSSRGTDAIKVGAKIGHFELIEQVGMGGFGAVWKAVDTKLDRTVAIKIPRKGQFDQDQERAFLREAQNAAQLKHPGIVPVHEVGREGDTLYIVSDFIEGLTLADWLEDQRPSTREATSLAAKIAAALHHAHERNVVHRDLKPGNVMLDDNLEPHLMDFGLARREVSDVTVSVDGNILGTPAYMSPEQAEGKGNQADRRSDIYSLGVLLFQLLTGELPFRGSLQMLLHQVINDEPPSPRSLNSGISQDLETITLKCLEKAPDRRYATAGEVMHELERVSRNEPIVARPISRAERTYRWIGRNKVVSALAAAVFLALVTGTIVSNYYAVSASKSAAKEKAASEQAMKSEQLAKASEQRAKEREAEAVTQLGKTKVALAEAAYLAGDSHRAIQLLDECDSSAHDTNWRYLKRYVDRSLYPGMGNTARGIRADPQAAGMFYVLQQRSGGDRHGALCYVDGKTNEVIEHILLENSLFSSLAISPDGTRLALVSRPHGRLLQLFETHPLRRKMQVPFKPPVAGKMPYFAADSRTLLLNTSPGTAQVDTDTGEVSQFHESFAVKGCANKQLRAYGSIDGKLAALDIESGEIIWDSSSTTGKSQTIWKSWHHEPKSIAVSFDDRWLVVERYGHAALLLSASNGREVARLDVHSVSEPQSCVASKKAPFFATLEKGSTQSVIRIWRYSNNDLKPCFTLSCCGESQGHIDLDIEAGIVMSGVGDRTSYSIPKMVADELPLECVAKMARFVTESTIALSHPKRFSLFNHKTATRIDTEWKQFNALTRSYNRDIILATRLGYDSLNKVRTLVSVNTESVDEFATMPFSGMDSFSVSPQGKYIAAASYGVKLAVLGQVGDEDWKPVLDLSRDEIPHKWQPPVSLLFPAGDSPVLLASFFRDFQGKQYRENRIYSLVSQEQIHSAKWPAAVTRLILDPQGRELCTGALDGIVRGYDARTLELLYEERCHDRQITALAYRPDGGAIATGDSSGLIRIWQIEEGRPTECLHELIYSPGAIQGLDFSPSGDTLLAESDTRIRLWDVR